MPCYQRHSLDRKSNGNHHFIMKAELVNEAAKVVTDPPILINMVSKRVAQLNRGRRPLLADTIGLGAADIALTEIIQGLIVIDDETGEEDA